MPDESKHLAVLDGVSVSLPLKTADQRYWSVELSWELIEKLDDRSIVNGEEAEMIVNGNMHIIEFAALRAIARGQVIGTSIKLTSADVRF